MRLSKLAAIVTLSTLVALPATASALTLVDEDLTVGVGIYGGYVGVSTPVYVEVPAPITQEELDDILAGGPVLEAATPLADVLTEQLIAAEDLANQNMLTLEQLAAEAQDPTTWSDPYGFIYYTEPVSSARAEADQHGITVPEDPAASAPVDAPEAPDADQEQLPEPAGGADTGDVADAAAPVTETAHTSLEGNHFTEAVAADGLPLLQSNPSATTVIHLDFDGHDASGTLWDTGDFDMDTGAWSLDGDRTTFNAQEQAAIKEIFDYVADDFAPFDVNVTTEDLGDFSIDAHDPVDPRYGSKVVFSPDQVVACSCGGVAYLGWFNKPGNFLFRPAWVWPNSLGNNAKNMAEAATHEAGHNLGLNHDGTSSSGYYTGHGSWAPIMGVAYSRQISQWSRGEYANANNTSDDYATMRINGLFARTDANRDLATARALQSSTLNEIGLISTPDDRDYYTVQVLDGTIDVSVRGVTQRAETPYANANLTVTIRLLDNEGAELDADSGRAPTVSATVPAGRYYIEVDGAGSGDPAANGYSDYGSLGYFALTGSTPTINPLATLP